ncbi:oligosaccharyl transferase subunit ost3/OST6 [Kickxella alabastrina]|uniref:Oligosaccharyl transferase subunit ost3/OST6 n=1 Tax=Kickxella alabastrina TaxID=61397 RepID=A0ACC1II11_9FUNG|nr:oligosaccharyl transferase subunit ost3/OST6 [Kickxella alabastrina]
MPSLFLLVITLLLTIPSPAHAQSFSQLKKHASKDADGLAQLDLKLFMKHVVAETKDYSVIVQLTALAPKYKCGPCKAIDTTLRSVSRGWKKQQNKGGKDGHQIIFASLDVEDGEELFRKMGIDNIPRFMIFPASQGPDKFDNASPREMKLNTKTSQPEGMAQKLGELFDVEFKPDIPVDYLKYLTNGAVLIAAAYAVFLVYMNIDLKRLGRNIWAIATILFVLLMSSGFMWSRINTPPYVGQTRSGDVVLFAPTNNQQYGVETQIVAATYAVCALCIVALVRHVPRIPNVDQRNFVTFMFVIALIMSFSYLNSVFRMKMPGYPYKMLLP